MNLTLVKYKDVNKKYYIATKHYENRIQNKNTSETLCLYNKKGKCLEHDMVSTNDLKVMQEPADFICVKVKGLKGKFTVGRLQYEANKKCPNATNLRLRDVFGEFIPLHDLPGSWYNVNDLKVKGG